MKVKVQLMCLLILQLIFLYAKKVDGWFSSGVSKVG